MMPVFARYVGIDYSGAETPTASLKGLRVYLAERVASPVEVPPPLSPRRYWTRKGIAEWLVERLAEDTPTLVGIDHGFSFPAPYFDSHGLRGDWDGFLADFQQHWPTDSGRRTVGEVRSLEGLARLGDPTWRRLTEKRTPSAKSVFHFNVPGVAASTHAGLPWLKHLRERNSGRVHFWPFDGWTVPAGKSVVAEVYPSMWSAIYAPQDRTPDEHDAFCVAAWMREADLSSSLSRFFEPLLSDEERRVADIEGWIFGVGVKP